MIMKLFKNPGFWIVGIILILLTVPHYREAITHPAVITFILERYGLDRHAFERIAYLIPIVSAGFVFGWKGSVITSIIALACMLPRALLLSDYRVDALFETSAVFIVGNITAFAFDALRRERENRIRLAALNKVSTAVSQSLELNQIMDYSIENIMSVMKIDAVLIFLVDRKAEELVLAAHLGASESFVDSISRLKLGEGLNGAVVLTGNPEFIDDTSLDPRLTRMAVKDEKVRSQLIVPMKSKGNVMGTLCVATRNRVRFKKEEVDTLIAIGSQIGIAIENAHLYQQERETSERLRVSEERYRELFENAHDAILVHNMEGDIISVNMAASRLTGYELNELLTMNINALLTPEYQKTSRQILARMREGEPVDQLYEQKIVTKKGTEAILTVAANVVRDHGRPVGYQYIARDVTRERRMQENLRYYLEQVTRAQEEERIRIARELHDDTIQALVVLSRQLDEIATSENHMPTDKKVELENLRQDTNNIMAGIRRLSQDLRPPTLDRLGLIPALEWLVDDVKKHSGLIVKLSVSGSERRLHPEAELLLFRIVQEALRNVWRHAEATEVKIKVETSSRIRITIKDNGKGFNVPDTIGDLAKDGRLGLVGMHERIQLIGGTLKMTSKPQKGTSLVIDVPL
jgi:two-component system, NarL family, sensor histidine kinase DegS